MQTKLIRALQTYLIYAFPAVLFVIIWGAMDKLPKVGAKAWVWDVVGWNLMIWFVLLVCYLALMVIVPEVRDRTLKRLANVRDRDEREEHITGKAARSAYLSTLSLLIVLLFFSVLEVRVYKTNPDPTDRRSMIAEGGFHFDLSDKPRLFDKPVTKMFFDGSELPLSKTGILLVLIVWQLVVFNLAARKESAAS